MAETDELMEFLEEYMTRGHVKRYIVVHLGQPNHTYYNIFHEYSNTFNLLSISTFSNENNYVISDKIYY